MCRLSTVAIVSALVLANTNWSDSGLAWGKNARERDQQDPGRQGVPEISPFAIVLIAISSFMHAGWNLLARKQTAEMEFFSRMLLITAFIGFLPAAASEALVRSLPARAWLCVLGSGLCCGVYYFSLARSYGSSDFTTVYPIARSLPVLLVAMGDVVLGRHPTPVGWLGILLVVSGCFLSPLRSFRDFAAHRYLNHASLWMFLTATGTAGYTLLDKAASELVRQGPASAARYGYIFFLISYGVYVLLLRAFKPRLRDVNRVGWLLPSFGALFNFGGYWLVLWAYQLTVRASYVLAFRQLSILIGVTLAFAIYKEGGKAVRIPATCLIIVGLVLISVWGH